jgi:Fe2+ or Zn2+ uptake regulation protein
MTNVHHFFNTIGEDGQQLADSNATSKSQEDLILSIFRRCDYNLTASDVWRWMKVHDTAILLTSVRRAMSNLCTQGYLEKTENKRMGIYGKVEHLYAKK